MKLKHFAGYGTINAKKISKVTHDGVTILSILVTGDHEQGLVPAYISASGDYTMKKWLIDRFDKSVKDVNLRHKTEYDYMDINGNAVRYTFIYRNDGSYLFEY